MSDKNTFLNEEEFGARFAAADFVPVANALRIRADTINLANLGNWLRPEFYAFYLSVAAQGPTRAERLRGLRRAGQAATELDAALDKIWLDLPLDFGGELHQFGNAVRQLPTIVEQKRQKLLAQPSPKGRPPKNTFQEFAARLMQLYQHLTKTPAKRPYWLGDSRAYGGEFFKFTRAVWKCIRDRVPEARSALPSSEDALAEHLRDHWRSITEPQAKN
jgi:hypothetical protein